MYSKIAQSSKQSQQMIHQFLADFAYVFLRVRKFLHASSILRVSLFALL